MKNQKGFTVVELVFVIALVAFLFGGGYVLIHFLVKFW